jgi:hypothetical protein
MGSIHKWGEIRGIVGEERIGKEINGYPCTGIVSH